MVGAVRYYLFLAIFNAFWNPSQNGIFCPKIAKIWPRQIPNALEPIFNFQLFFSDQIKNIAMPQRNWQKFAALFAQKNPHAKMNFQVLYSPTSFVIWFVAVVQDQLQNISGALDKFYGKGNRLIYVSWIFEILLSNRNFLLSVSSPSHQQKIFNAPEGKLLICCLSKTAASSCQFFGRLFLHSTNASRAFLSIFKKKKKLIYPHLKASTWGFWENRFLI